MPTEQDRLMKRLFDDPSRRLLNFDIVRENAPTTTEEICGAVNKVMDAIERRHKAGDLGDGPVRTGKPPINIRDLVSRL